jgi:hypothetical protein
MKVFSVTIQDNKENIFIELMNSVSYTLLICFLIARWNTHIIIFGWCENFLMGISFVKKIEAVSDDNEIPQWHKAILDQRIEDKAEDYPKWGAVQENIKLHLHA